MLSTLTETRKAIQIKPKSRTWLDVDNAKDKKKYDKLVPVMQEIDTLAEAYCHCYSTCRVENLNWVTSSFCPKTTEFWKRYPQRVQFVTLRFNTDTLEELYSDIMQEIGIPAGETLQRRWKSADEKRKKEKAWNKSIEKKRRKLQLELHTAHQRAKEKAESARITKERAFKSLEYTQGDILSSSPVSTSSNPSISTSPSPAPSALPPTTTPPSTQPRTKETTQKKAGEKWQDVLDQVRTIGIAQSEGSKKLGRKELRDRLSAYLSDPSKYQHYLGKRKKTQAKKNTKEKISGQSQGTLSTGAASINVSG